MASGATAQALENMALNLTGQGAWISLHTANPGVAGTTGEASGGSPAYARKQTTWTGGTADGTVTGSQVTFDVQAGTYNHIGIWTAQTGGTFIGWSTITATTLGAQGQVLVTPTVQVTIS